MGHKNRTYIDDMVEQFGYDYVIGYCLCSEYSLNNIAENEPDPEKKDALKRKAYKYGRDAEMLLKERVECGL